MNKCLTRILFTAILALASGFIQAADIEFRSQPYEYAVKGNLISGKSFTLQYDNSRLSRCTARGRMYQSFTVVEYRFDGGEVQVRDISGSEIEIVIPEGANTLEVWFRNYTLTSPMTPPVCEAYDSNYGKNYSFKILDF